MYAVIFEVFIKEGRQGDYLRIASEIREHLKDIDGFISVERFSSLYHEGKVCSLSFWNSMDAINKWRRFELHRFAQEKGRSDIFLDYRIRVAEVIRDYGMSDRMQAPVD